MWDIDAGARVSETLAMLRDEVSRLLLRRVPSESPAIRLPSPPPPPLPSGPLTPASLCAVVAATQPEGTILVDESLTSGGSYWDVSAGCPRFTHLALTGGAIGFGPPASVGAAVAAPGRRAINLKPTEAVCTPRRRCGRKRANASTSSRWCAPTRRTPY